MNDDLIFFVVIITADCNKESTLVRCKSFVYREYLPREQYYFWHLEKSPIEIYMSNYLTFNHAHIYYIYLRDIFIFILWDITLYLFTYTLYMSFKNIKKHPIYNIKKQNSKLCV